MKTKEVSRAEEKQALLSVLASLGTEATEGWFSRLKRELALLLMAAIIIFIILMIQGTQFRFTLTVAALGFFAGLILGGTAQRFQSSRLWPAIAKCIDRSKVEARLRELDA